MARTKTGTKAGKGAKKAARAGTRSGAAVTTAKQARRDAVTITKLERAVTVARADEEKRRRQLERALEAVAAAEARLADGRALIAARLAAEQPMSPPPSQAAAPPAARAARPAGARVAGAKAPTTARTSTGPRPSSSRARGSTPAPRPTTRSRRSPQPGAKSDRPT